MERQWSFLNNTMEESTRGSFRLGLRISRIHYEKLHARNSNAAILALENSYKPFDLDYRAKYSAWKSQERQQLVDSATLTGKFLKLSNEKINGWDASIQVVYPKGSARYNTMLGDGHAPFQKGTQSEKIEAIASLSTNIGADVALAAVKTDVDNFIIEINGAYDTQKSSIDNTGTKSDALEISRLAMCGAQYNDLGGLMTINNTAGHPELTGDYFDLLSIRNIKQMLFQGTMKTNNIHNIVQRTLAATDQLLLENDGITELRFYLSTVKNGAIGAIFKTVAAGTSLTVSAADLGDVATMHFLMAYNPDDTDKGHFTVEFL